MIKTLRELTGFVLFMTAVITTSLYANENKSKATPVLLVRGIDCSDEFLKYIKKAVHANGRREVRYASYSPRFGQAGIDYIGGQIAEAAKRLKEETGSDKIDIVGFSMGALASRYFIQRLGGKKIVRKFVSISGPHNGTYSAWFRLFHKGVRDMLPGSDLINDLNADKDPWGDVHVYSFLTPYDLIVVPASTAILKDSKEVKEFEVALHHLMVKSPQVISEVVNVLEKAHEVKLESVTSDS